MRTKQMSKHSNLSKMKTKILPTYLQGNYGDSLGEFCNISYCVFGAKRLIHLQFNLVSFLLQCQ